MIKKLYLISGFLGSGKTTLVKELINIFSDKKIAVIVNEFGKQGIDGEILKEKGIEIEEISNGSIFCVCRSDLFYEALNNALNNDSEIVLVETSGLSDPNSIDKILSMLDKKNINKFDFCGTIVMVDAKNFLKTVYTSVAVRQQIISAGIAIINKIDMADNENINKVIEVINDIHPQLPIRQTTFSKIQSEWFDLIEINKIPINGKIPRRTVGSESFLIKIPENTDFLKLNEWVDSFLSSTFRLKGFVNTNNGWKFIDCTHDQKNINDCEIKKSSSLVVLSSSTKHIKEIMTDNWIKIFNTEIIFI